jgi:putative NAD(P)H nitroreductase
MDVAEALVLRKTVRRFEKEGLILQREQIEEMLALAALAPSELGLKPWRFVVVRDSARRESLYECCYRQELIREASAIIIVCGDTLAFQEAQNRACAEAKEGTAKNQDANDYADLLKRFYTSDQYQRFMLALRSPSACAMALMLVATERGIGSCPIYHVDEACLRREFGIPDHWVVVMLCALGMPAGDAQAFEKTEKTDVQGVVWHEGVETMRF